MSVKGIACESKTQTNFVRNLNNKRIDIILVDIILVDIILVASPTR